ALPPSASLHVERRHGCTARPTREAELRLSRRLAGARRGIVPHDGRRDRGPSQRTDPTVAEETRCERLSREARTGLIHHRGAQSGRRSSVASVLSVVSPIEFPVLYFAG